jgi:hypothetical protein
MAPSWADVAGKGVRQPHTTPGSPSFNPVARILAVYRACVAEGLWVRVQLESREGEEEISLCCRSSPTAALTTPRRARKRPANERRREKQSQRREVWASRRKNGPSVHQAAAGAACSAANTLVAATRGEAIKCMCVLNVKGGGSRRGGAGGVQRAVCARKQLT